MKQAYASGCARTKGEITIGRHVVHHSHNMSYNCATGYHFCTSCGAAGRDFPRKLREECTHELKQAGEQNLRRLEKDLTPGSGPTAAAANFGKLRHRQDTLLAATLATHTTTATTKPTRSSAQVLKPNLKEQAREKPRPQPKGPILNPSAGISQTLLETIRAKEAANRLTYVAIWAGTSVEPA